jgi:hypothetical protein
MPAPSPRKKLLSDLKASILNPALTSHFECTFNPPQLVREWIEDKNAAGLGIPYTGNEDFISLSCSEAALPGSSLATHEINNDHSGVTERHAYRRQYDDRASFTFYVDHDYNIIYFFENWISYIVNEQFVTGVEEPNFFYRVNFPKQYQTTIYLKKFERDYNGRILQYRFINAYPISIDSMPVSYDSSQLLKCTVSFNYSRYVIGGGEILNSKIPNSSALRGVTDEQILDAMSFATSPTQESLEANYYNTVYGES